MPRNVTTQGVEWACRNGTLENTAGWQTGMSEWRPGEYGRVANRYVGIHPEGSQDSCQKTPYGRHDALVCGTLANHSRVSARATLTVSQWALGLRHQQGNF